MITAAIPDDIPDLAQMLRGLNALHTRHLPERFHDTGSEVELRSFFRDRMGQGAQILIYRTETVARGYLMWMAEERAETMLERAGAQAVLDHIYVAPGWRRRGIGGRLIRRFEAEARAAGHAMWLTRVPVFNRASLTLMEGAGATPAVHALVKPL
ncbi:GNAT family N-acetyltransferase [Primorskyibacter aestuariivivens]|uniref:GNAT family N-acetyltransferase n=1 Tax=Primorskyibacter aestuariivivens TaxID=1888912 RepID=UPI0023010EF9|nr:GNAT family N-acetyltransferase [Primorskyibacter aestuariivivens]MDA7430077.1 GNAT family N-acetyltransferase [Primorskyibacter aestuariivivens]